MYPAALPQAYAEAADQGSQTTAGCFGLCGGVAAPGVRPRRHNLPPSVSDCLYTEIEGGSTVRRGREAGWGKPRPAQSCFPTQRALESRGSPPRGRHHRASCGADRGRLLGEPQRGILPRAPGIHCGGACNVGASRARVLATRGRARPAIILDGAGVAGQYIRRTKNVDAVVVNPPVGTPKRTGRGQQS